MVSVPSEDDDVSSVHADKVELEWDVDMETQLFYAMANHKPVGINKHFHMACIWEKLTNSITKEVSTHDIWKHINTLYDISMLDDTEPIPFPNKEVPFSLPESEFGELMKEKCKETCPVLADETEAVPPPVVSRKSSATPVTANTRKESVSSHASTDTPSIKSDKDYDRRRDSRDSNASGPKEGSGRKSKAKLKVNSLASAMESPLVEEDNSRRGRRRANTSTPPATTPAKRRRI